MRREKGKLNGELVCTTVVFSSFFVGKIGKIERAECMPIIPGSKTPLLRELRDLLGISAGHPGGIPFAKKSCNDHHGPSISVSLGIHAVNEQKRSHLPVPTYVRWDACGPLKTIPISFLVVFLLNPLFALLPQTPYVRMPGLQDPFSCSNAIPRR